MIRNYYLMMCLLALSTSSVFSRVIECDIHGVLLHEDIDRYVKHKKHMAELEEMVNGTTDSSHRGGVQDNDLFRKLCKLMMKHAPLGPPTEEFLKYVKVQMSLPEDKRKLIPFETYQLFCGAVPPADMYPKITAMIDTVIFDKDDKEEDAEERRDMRAFVDAIFQREELVRETMIRLQEGINILRALVSNPENTVIIYSNAPYQWVEMYSTVFPDVFGKDGLVKQENILSSGLTGHLKPLKESFDAVRKHTGIDESETIYLIDDSPSNIAGSVDYNVTGIHFSYKKPHECVARLVELGILSEEDAKSLGTSLATQRAPYQFGHEVGFF